MSAGPQISFLVRCRDEAHAIGALLDVLAQQTVRGEVVVVDSGSVDGTLEEVRARGIEPIEIAPREFTYGRALNLAAAAASAEACVAISAHAMPPDAGWGERMVGALAGERIACASGERRGPDLRPLAAPVRQDLEHASRHPFWGYSNSAGAFQRSLWERRPFDESLPASEDKEWAWHWLGQGWFVRIDPALWVHHSHAGEGPVRTFRRTRAYFGAQLAFRSDLGRPPALAGAREWALGPHAHRSRLRALADPRRAAAIAGKHTGLRRGPGDFRHGRR